MQNKSIKTCLTIFSLLVSFILVNSVVGSTPPWESPLNSYTYQMVDSNTFTQLWCQPGFELANNGGFAFQSFELDSRISGIGNELLSGNLIKIYMTLTPSNGNWVLQYEVTDTNHNVLVPQAEHVLWYPTQSTPIPSTAALTQMLYIIQTGAQSNTHTIQSYLPNLNPQSTTVCELIILPDQTLAHKYQNKQAKKPQKKLEKQSPKIRPPYKPFVYSTAETTGLEHLTISPVYSNSTAANPNFSEINLINNGQAASGTRSTLANAIQNALSNNQDVELGVYAVFKNNVPEIIVRAWSQGQTIGVWGFTDSKTASGLNVFNIILDSYVVTIPWIQTTQNGVGGCIKITPPLTQNIYTPTINTLETLNLTAAYSYSYAQDSVVSLISNSTPVAGKRNALATAIQNAFNTGEDILLNIYVTLENSIPNITLTGFTANGGAPLGTWTYVNTGNTITTDLQALTMQINSDYPILKFAPIGTGQNSWAASLFISFGKSEGTYQGHLEQPAGTSIVVPFPITFTYGFTGQAGKSLTITEENPVITFVTADTIIANPPGNVIKMPAAPNNQLNNFSMSNGSITGNYYKMSLVNTALQALEPDQYYSLIAVQTPQETQINYMGPVSENASNNEVANLLELIRAVYQETNK